MTEESSIQTQKRERRTEMAFLAALLLVMLVRNFLPADPVVVPESVRQATQQQIRARVVDKVQQDDILAWPESRQVAEFLCRPAALKEIQKTVPQVDRVFLGGENGQGLQLEDAGHLTGEGLYRTGSTWSGFHFECGLSGKDGQVMSFRLDGAGAGIPLAPAVKL